MPAEPNIIPNPLADRYASRAIRALWSPRGKVIEERRFWIAVMKAQRDLGVAIPAEAIQAYEAALEDVDLDDIRRREEVTRHDVKARLDSFNARVGHEHLHKGLTSRDLTENVEQMQILRGLRLLRHKAAGAAWKLADRVDADRDLLFTARTHNVPAQPTTLGRRWAMFGEELLLAIEALDHLLSRYPLRGLKGAVGTQQDQLTLLGGDATKVDALEARIVAHLGESRALAATGQVYPRSLDFAVVSALVQLASGPSSFATTLRLMAGHELASEGFAPGQTGSSSMPHKMNARSCERLNGLALVLKGHLTMVAGLAGTQWNEGDVSCSVVRRVALPDAFFATDGLFEAFLTILRQMEVYPAVIQRENQRYLPYLITTTLLMAAVQAGAGREEAHAALKAHTTAAIRAERQGLAGPDLLDNLAGDPRLRLSRARIAAILEDAGSLTGQAIAQAAAFVARVRASFATAQGVEPEPGL